MQKKLGTKLSTTWPRMANIEVMCAKKKKSDSEFFYIFYIQGGFFDCSALKMTKYKEK